MSRAMPYPHAETKALYVYGLMHIWKGEPEQARERLETALRICNRLGERIYSDHIEHALMQMRGQVALGKRGKAL